MRGVLWKLERAGSESVNPNQFRFQLIPAVGAMTSVGVDSAVERKSKREHSCQV